MPPDSAFTYGRINKGAKCQERTSANQIPPITSMAILSANTLLTANNPPDLIDHPFSPIQMVRAKDLFRASADMRTVIAPRPRAHLIDWARSTTCRRLREEPDPLSLVTVPFLCHHTAGLGQLGLTRVSSDAVN